MVISQDLGFNESHLGIHMETSPDTDDDRSTVKLYPSPPTSDQSSGELASPSPFASMTSGGKEDSNLGSPESFDVKPSLQALLISWDDHSRNASSRVSQIKLKECSVSVLKLTQADVERIQKDLKVEGAAEKRRVDQQMEMEPLQPEEIWRRAQDRFNAEGIPPLQGKPRNFAIHFQQKRFISQASSSTSSVGSVGSRAGKSHNSTMTGNQGSSTSTQQAGTSSSRHRTAKRQRSSKRYFPRGSRSKTSHEESDSDPDFTPVPSSSSRKRSQNSKRALSSHSSDDGTDWSSDDSLFVEIKVLKKKKRKKEPESSTSVEFRAGTPLTAEEMGKQNPAAVHAENQQQLLDGPQILPDFNNFAIQGPSGANELDLDSIPALLMDENGSTAWMDELLKCDMIKQCVDDAMASGFCPNVDYLDVTIDQRDPEQILAALDADAGGSTSAASQNEPMEVSFQPDVSPSSDTSDRVESDIDFDILVIDVGDERLY